MDYLKENLMYAEILEISERAIEIKPYEDSINIKFMEALVELKQGEYALRHYEFFTRKLFIDLKLSPSKKLIEFYNKIKSKNNSFYSNIDLNTMEEELKSEFDSKRLIFSDPDNFKFMYNYELRNKNRRVDIKIELVLITLESRSYKELTEEELQRGMKLLADAFSKHLKPVDLVSKWNENQIIMLIYDHEEVDIENIVDKINHKFNLRKRDDKLSLNIKTSSL